MYGTIFITNKLEEAQITMNHSFVLVFVDEESVKEYEYTGFLPVGVLMPPFESLSAEVDMNLDLAAQLYVNHLEEPNRQKTFGVILAALRNGKNICLYVPNDQVMSFHFVVVLMNYMISKFGINIADRIGLGFNPECLVDSNFEPARLNSIMGSGYMDVTDYAANYPDNMYPSIDAAIELVKPYALQTNDPNELLQFAYGVICSTKQSIRNNMTNIVVRSVELNNKQKSE